VVLDDARHWDLYTKLFGEIDHFPTEVVKMERDDPSS